MFALISSLNLDVDFDPVSTDGIYLSVAFDVTANWKMPYQQAQITAKECWFGHFELNQFEENLRHLSKRQNDLVKLSDIGTKPIMHFSRTDLGEILFQFKVGDTFDMGTITIETTLEDQELLEIIDNIKNWAKWW